MKLRLSYLKVTFLVASGFNYDCLVGCLGIYLEGYFGSYLGASLSGYFGMFFGGYFGDCLSSSY